MKTIEDLKNTIMCCDVIEGLKKIPDSSVHLVVTSPPYNINLQGYKNRNDNDPYHIYVEWLNTIFIECKRILVDGGRLIINIDSVRNRQDEAEYMRPIAGDLINMGRSIGMKYRTEICWYKQNWSGRATAFGSYMSCSNPTIRRNHEYIMIWSKGDWKLDGDQEMSDMTPEEFQTWTFSTWFVQPEVRNLNDHPAPYPEELVRRLIKLYSYRGNIVVDPFMGTGTTGLVCKLNHRFYIGIDNSAQDVEFAIKRIDSVDNIFDEYVPRSTRIQKNKQEKTDYNSTNIL
jgi:site-specific DNA-methyltransferase (adenine-specific)